MKYHVDALAIMVVYDLYKEYITESLALEAFRFDQKDEINVMDFHTFKVDFLNQGLLYTVTRIVSW